MSIIDRLCAGRVNKAVQERDSLWSRAVKDSFFTEGGHPLANGTVSVWNPQTFPNGISFEANWGYISYREPEGATLTNENLVAF